MRNCSQNLEAYSNTYLLWVRKAGQFSYVITTSFSVSHKATIKVLALGLSQDLSQGVCWGHSHLKVELEQDLLPWSLRGYGYSGG
jgi:hypothetical protein